MKRLDEERGGGGSVGFEMLGLEGRRWNEFLDERKENRFLLRERKGNEEMRRRDGRSGFLQRERKGNEKRWRDGRRKCWVVKKLWLEVRR